MKILSSTIHGFLDYVVIIAFALAPTVFGLEGAPAAISYILAVVHLLLTILTAFPLGLIKVIPAIFHGWIEFVVAICLIAIPFVAGFIGAARNFYVAAGIIIFVVWLITNFETTESPAA
ncbi:MAG: hypothetical protein M3033_17510 [Acidobacteriota bacterium]|nr:hypothetical protein [Acidobacteriota bacterium]